MAEKFITTGNKKVILKPVEDLVVVKYSKPMSHEKASNIIANKGQFVNVGDNVRTYPSQNISLITRPLGETLLHTKKFSDSLAEDDNIEFVSSAYKDSDSGALLIITDQMDVSFKKDTPKENIQKIISEFDLSIVRQSEFSPQIYTLKVNNAKDSEKTIDVCNKLSERSEIEYVDPVTLTEFKKHSNQIPAGKYFIEQWHLHNLGQGNGTVNEDVNALQAWNITRGNPDITIAVVDDGLAYSHEDLKDNVWTNPDPLQPDIHGRNFFDNVPDPAPIYFRPPFDELSGNDIHGTPCAGVISAVGESRSGVCGIAPKCKIMGVKIFGGDAMAQPAQVAEAIRYAGLHADVVSCSWGTPVPNDSISQAIKAVSQSGRKGRGCPIFVATGNSAPEPISFPASMKETIAIGASTNVGTRAFYSQFGPEIDFLAPSNGGTKGIFTTDLPDENRGFNIGKPGQGDPEGLYTNRFGGTSSATPLAAGIAALLLSINPQLTAEKIRQILRSSCEKIDIPNAKYDPTGFSNTHGYGRVNAKRALELAKN